MLPTRPQGRAPRRLSDSTGPRCVRAAIGTALLGLLAACAQVSPAKAREERIGTTADMMTLTLDLQAPTFRNQDRLYPTRAIRRGAQVLSLPAGTPLKPITYTVADGTFDLDQFMARNRTAGLIVIKDGKVALERYSMGNNEHTKWMSFSVAKSFTSVLIGAAIRDGYIQNIDEPVVKYVPALKGSAYDRVSIRNVLQMSSGVRWNEDYLNPQSENRKMMLARTSGEPGAALRYLATLPRAATPGTRFNYSTGETYLVGEILRGAIKRPLSDYLSEKIWAPFGMGEDGYWQLESKDGQEYAGSGISATLRDYGRFGLFVQRGGLVNGQSIFPEGWLAQSTDAKAGGRLAPGAIPHYEPMGYGYQWWTYPEGMQALPHLAGGMFAAHGIFGQSIYINPGEKLVIAIHSAWPKPITGKSIGETLTLVAAITAALH